LRPAASEFEEFHVMFYDRLPLALITVLTYLLISLSPNQPPKISTFSFLLLFGGALTEGLFLPKDD
jgi:hypothetical protein